MEINGVAHTFITVGNFAIARAFYGQLLPFLGAEKRLSKEIVTLIAQRLTACPATAQTIATSRHSA
jgi:hypothetical protein